jgi:hypothetical protein
MQSRHSHQPREALFSIPNFQIRHRQLVARVVAVEAEGEDAALLLALG